MTKFYSDEAGNYVGGFDGVTPPAGSIEVPTAPDRADCIWDGSVWTPPAPEVLRAGMPGLSPRQLRLALLSINIAEADVDMKLVNDPAGMIEWKYATYFKRTHPLVEGLGALFTITAGQIDSLWNWAAAL